MSVQQYTEHGLQIIRFSNGLSAAAAGRLDALTRELWATIAMRYRAGMTQRQLMALVREVQDNIAAAYAQINASQTPILRQFIDTEIDFAVRASNLRRLSAANRHAAVNRLRVYGNTLEDQWTRQAQNTAFSVIGQLRQGAATNATLEQLAATITGNADTVGIMQQAQRHAASLTDSAVNSARSTAHLASFKNDPDILALRWFAILDVKVCPNCGLRAGKLYDLDLKPIGHDIPLVGEPPLHPYCRCMLVPSPTNVPTQNDRFENWLDRQSMDKQEELLGAGRVALWREGRITLNDLIGQKGLVMSLQELRLKLGLTP